MLTRKRKETKFETYYFFCENYTTFNGQLYCTTIGQNFELQIVLMLLSNLEDKDLRPVSVSISTDMFCCGGNLTFSKNNKQSIYFMNLVL